MIPISLRVALLTFVGEPFISIEGNNHPPHYLILYYYGPQKLLLRCVRNTTLMHAIVYSGGVLKLEEVEKPIPADNEVLVRVRAASVNLLDYHFLRHPFMRPVMARVTK